MRHFNRAIAVPIFLFGLVLLQAANGQAPVPTNTKGPNGGLTIQKDDTKKDDTKKDDAKKDEPKKDDAPKVNYHKLPKVMGHIVSVDEGKKSLKVSVEMQVPNPDGQNEYVQATLNYQRNPRDVNALIRLQKAQAGLVKTVKKEMEYGSIDTVKVRMAEPPAQFDDKGKLKTYTAKEKAELKGSDKTTPGYPAEFSDLHTGMLVELKMVSKKDPARFANKTNLTPEEQDDIKPMMTVILGAEAPKQPGAPGS